MKYFIAILILMAMIAGYWLWIRQALKEGEK